MGFSLFLLVLFYLFISYSSVARITGFLIGLWAFYFFDHAFDLKFEVQHYMVIVAMLFFGILLAPLYFISSGYDKVLHFVMPILGGFVLFYIIDKERLSFKWKLFITFMFVISFLAIHEIGEYLIDQIWDFKLQGVYVRDISGLEKFNLVQSKIDDTMIDMILGVIGALTFVVGKCVAFRFKVRHKKKFKRRVKKR